jgi:hypothetical protein
MIYKTQDAAIDELHKKTDKLYKMIDNLISSFNSTSIDLNERMTNMKEHNIIAVNNMSSSIINNEQLLIHIQSQIQRIQAFDSIDVQEIMECSRSLSTQDQHNSTCNEVSEILIKKSEYINYLLLCFGEMVTSIDGLNNNQISMNRVLFNNSKDLEEYANNINGMFIDYIDKNKMILEELRQINGVIENKCHKIMRESELLKNENSKIIETKDMEIDNLKKSSMNLSDQLEKVQTEYIDAQCRNQELNESVHKLNESIMDLSRQLTAERERSVSLLHELSEGKVIIDRTIECDDKNEVLDFNYIDGPMISGIKQNDGDNSFNFDDMEIVAGAGIEKVHMERKSISKDVGDDNFNYIEPFEHSAQKIRPKTVDSIFKSSDKILNSAVIDITPCDSSDEEELSVPLEVSVINRDIERRMMQVLDCVMSNGNIDDMPISGDLKVFIQSKQDIITKMNKEREIAIADKDMLLNNVELKSKLNELEGKFNDDDKCVVIDKSTSTEVDKNAINVNSICSQTAVVQMDVGIDTSELNRMRLQSNVLFSCVKPTGDNVELNKLIVRLKSECKDLRRQLDGKMTKDFHSFDDLANSPKKTETLSVPDKLKNIKIKKHMKKLKNSGVKYDGTFYDKELNDYVPQFERIRRKKLNFLTDNDLLSKIESEDDAPYFGDLNESEIHREIPMENMINVNIDETPRNMDASNTLDTSDMNMCNWLSSQFVMTAMVVFVMISAVIHCAKEWGRDDDGEVAYNGVKHITNYENDVVKAQ